MNIFKYPPILLSILIFLSCQEECPTEPGTIDSFYWDISVEQVVGTEGGTLTDPTTGAKLEVPAGAVIEETTFFMGPAYNMPIDNSVHISTSEYYFGPNNIIFLKPVIVTIPYNESDIPAGIIEEDLQMHVYTMTTDIVSTSWNYAVDTANNIISLNTNQLRFCVPGGDISPNGSVLKEPSNIIDNTLTLNWSKNTEGDFDLYKVYYGLQANVSTSNILLSQITDRHQNVYVVSGLNPETTYYFKVFTYDVNGLVTESNEVMTTTISQSNIITFNDVGLENVIRENLNMPTGDITNTDLATITSLNGNDSKITDLSVLKYCTNLQWLYLDNNLFSDLTPLSSLSNLTGLYLGRNSISDISPLITLVNLTDLSLYRNQVTDISILKYLVNLDYLSLSYNSVENVNSIKNLPLLNYLYLSNNNITSISGLKNLPELHTLSIEFNYIDNIDKVAEFPKLAYFYAEGNNISNINSLTNLTELDNVDLEYNKIVDIGPLSDNHPNLRYLYLSHNNITEVPTLSNLASLISCYLSYNNISDISGLAEQVYVQYLYLYYNNIVDISSLETLTNIIGLGISYNNIEDLEPLVNNVGLDNGDYIYAYGNNYSDTSINTHIPALQARGVNVYR